jgi:hypothetical protein
LRPWMGGCWKGGHAALKALILLVILSVRSGLWLHPQLYVEVRVLMDQPLASNMHLVGFEVAMAWDRTVSLSSLIRLYKLNAVQVEIVLLFTFFLECQHILHHDRAAPS